MLTVCDITSALVQKRSYKVAMDKVGVRTILSEMVSKADLNNSSQQINAGVVSAPTGNFTNITNDLSKKIEVVSYGDVTLTGKIAVSGWYIKKRIVLGGSVRYEFEITIPTFNISTFINQNSDIMAQDDAINNPDNNIPPYLKNHTEDSKNYKYPHDYGGYFEQQYLPDSLKNRKYFNDKK